MSGTMDPMATDVDQQELAQQFLTQTKEQGIDLVGADGLLNRLTKNGQSPVDAVFLRFQSGLQDVLWQMDEHLGYGKHDPFGR